LSINLRAVVNDGAIVAESPMWSGGEQALYWLDGRRDMVYRFDHRSGARAEWPVPSRVNALALSAGGLVVAMKSGVALLDVVTGTFATIAQPETARPDIRMNDAKVDRAGRLWFGSMHDDAAAAIGRVFRLTYGEEATAVDEDFTVPNGFAFSPDDRCMYLADSKLSTIYVYDYDRAAGDVRNRRAFAQPPAGNPDGATIDAQGYLWSACIGGFALARYAPDGSLNRIVELPVERPTSVMFGGPDLKTLYVTTATRGFSPEQRAAQPLSGAVLALDVDVPGLPEPLFA
jgi:L-arabinonolactonase